MNDFVQGCVAVTGNKAVFDLVKKFGVDGVRLGEAERTLAATAKKTKKVDVVKGLATALTGGDVDIVAVSFPGSVKDLKSAAALAADLCRKVAIAHYLLWYVGGGVGLPKLSWSDFETEGSSSLALRTAISGDVDPERELKEKIIYL